ncbi:uncharacterized protein EAE97_009831 [Botrytis byssoidea]|uniref:Uncharacterized protein n=1 Tax=Botrytis byssoidea TaxID=139641 RepID=A0A9P5I2F2_9HELO|nr:uncharacterized protein EAE97_009831 [Botrytis byssoidea]KAF7928033.1 hypothetical protein EAE97_009831 [Botrytis byssoidea]
MSKSPHSRDEASHGRDRGAGRSSRATSRRQTSQSSSSTARARANHGSSQRRSPRDEVLQGSPSTTQARGSDGGYHAEASEVVSRSQSFMPSVSMSMLCSEFTPRVAPTTDTSMRDREHCGSCGEYREAPMLPEWWKGEHFTDHPECLAAYQAGTCQLERTDAQIEEANGSDAAFRGQINWVPPINTENPVQDCAPQTMSTSVWSQGASQPSTQPNNPSTFYNQSAGYADPTGQTGNTGYAPSSYVAQTAPHYSDNTGYIAPSYMLSPPVPSYPSNAASTSYAAPPGRIRTGLSPPGQAPATDYPPPPTHHISYNIPYSTQPQATHQPAPNNPPQGEQYASATSGLQQGSSHRGSSGHGHSHSQGRGSSRRDNRPKK